MEKTFAEILREKREKQGLSQLELAQKVGLTGSYISILESRRKPPPSDNVIRKIARVLKIDPDQLLSIAHLERSPQDIRNHLIYLSKIARPKTGKGNLLSKLINPFAMPFEANDEKVLFKKGLNSATHSPTAGSPNLLPILSDFSIPILSLRKLPSVKYKEVSSEIWKQYRFCFIADEDKGMTPKIEVGDILIIDPSLKPKDSDMVLIKHNSNGLIRRYYQRPDNKVELLAFNPDVPPLHWGKTQLELIKGVVIQIIRDIK